MAFFLLHFSWLRLRVEAAARALAARNGVLSADTSGACKISGSSHSSIRDAEAPPEGDYYSPIFGDTMHVDAAARMAPETAPEASSAAGCSVLDAGSNDALGARGCGLLTTDAVARLPAVWHFINATRLAKACQVSPRRRRARCAPRATK